MKECANCHITKNKKEFWKYAKTRDGLQGYCKSCMREAWNKWRAEHKKEAIESVRRWEYAHPDHFSAWRRAYMRVYMQNYRKSQSFPHPKKEEQNGK